MHETLHVFRRTCILFRRSGPEDRHALFLSTRRKRKGRAKAEVWPLCADSISSDVKDLLNRMELPEWQSGACSSHYIRGHTGSMLRAAGLHLPAVLKRLDVTAAVFDKHYSRRPHPTVLQRLLRRKRGSEWQPTEIPFV